MGIYFDSLVWDLLSIIIVLICIIYLHFQYAYGYWESLGVPQLTPKFPYGNFQRLMQRKENFGLAIADKYHQLKRTGSPYGGVYMFSSPSLLLMDPEYIKLILIKEFNKFPDRGIYSNPEGDPLSGNMFAIKGHLWKKMRGKISPTFTSGKMKMMFQTLVEISKQLEYVLEKEVSKNKSIDFKDLLSRFTTDIIGSCVFGLECNSMKDPKAEFRHYGNMFLSRSLSNTILLLLGFFIPGVLKFFNVRITDKECEEFFMGVLKKNIDYREKNNVHRKDFMDLFIKLKNNENIQDDNLIVESKVTDPNPNEGITFEELSAQAFVFFIAGYETSSTTSSVCLYELAKNMDIQEKLYNEINTVLKKYNGELTYEGVMEMKYLDMVVNETLRKYPIAPNLIRICREQYQFEETGLVVEPGTQVWISILGMHHDPQYYPEPEKFDPLRFTEEEKAKRPAYTYLPFGEGPRNCVGMRFGLMQTKVALVSLLKNHKFSLGPSSVSSIEWTPRGVLLFPKDEIRLHATRVQ